MKIILLLLLFFAAQQLQAQQVRNTYRLYNSLATTETDCAADLVPARGLNIECQPATSSATGGFTTDIMPLSNIVRPVYHNNLGWGLKYLNTNGVIGRTYTVQMYVRVTNFNKYYTRVIDFSDGVEDNGIYFTNYGLQPASNRRCFNFFPNGNFGTCPFFDTATYYLLTITRNDATKLIDIYVNDQKFTTYNDAGKFYIGATGKPVHIFRDDPIGFACEDGEANFAYLSFANYYSTAADVTLVYQNIHVIANTVDIAASSSTACVGENLNFSYSGNIVPTATQYNFTWNWDGGTVVSGSGRGPYVISWNTNGTKTISLTISGGGCTSSITSSRQAVIAGSSATIIDTAICTGSSYEGYTTTGSYIDQFITPSGCDSTRTLNLTVESCDIYFPTAFTPNKDGKNEVFKISTNINLPRYRLMVYNRYGEKVFESNHPRVGWDGRQNGKDAATGVYVWICYLRTNAMQSEKVLKGTVMLMR